MPLERAACIWGTLYNNVDLHAGTDLHRHHQLWSNNATDWRKLYM